MSSTAQTNPHPRLLLMTPSGVRHTADHNAVIGRHASADIVLADPLASRRHARLEHGAGRWSITDLGSRHGTRINGSPATPDSPLRLAEGDEIVIGQSRLTVRFSDAVSSLKSPPTPDDAGTITDIQTSGDRGLSAERLRTLSRLTRKIIAAGNETQVLRLVTDAVRDALTVERVAVIERDQTTGRLIERAVSGASGISASRGFVAAAIDSDSVVRLDQQPELAGARSVHLQNIRSALCVRLGEQAERNPLVLHATDRREILERDDEAANLFASAAEVAGLAIANLRHAEIEAQKLAADREFAVAARVQRRMLPPDNGEAGPLRFASLIKPGRVIAGDMCSVFEIADDRAAFVVGDVSGKGAGPGLLMAMTLSHLRALLAEGHTIRYAVDRLNRFVFNHSAQNEFVTLLAGIVERGGNVHLVDAGHGLAFLCRDDVVRRITINGGVPLGVISDNAYDSTTATLREDERLLIVSDGVVEQRNQNGEQFQDRGIADALRGSESCENDVRSISRALAAHTGGAAFADDVTILSVLHLP